MTAEAEGIIDLRLVLGILPEKGEHMSVGLDLERLNGRKEYYLGVWGGEYQKFGTV